jgi:tRNA-dihydrouridine synthase B
MAGYTDMAFRKVCLGFGAGAVYTEVANAMSMLRNSKPTLHLLYSTSEETPIAGHIYGSEPKVLAEAARIVEDMGQFDYIDINTGCPVRKIVRKGSGAALMKNPTIIGEIVEAVTKSVSLPVTVKTRIGFYDEDINIDETAHIVESAGASALAIHARTAEQGHAGEADWDHILRVKSNIGIPVIGNGGIKTPDAALAAMDTGVDGIMIARGAVGTPWIFRQIHQLLAGEEPTTPSLAEKKILILQHLDALIELKVIEAEHRKKKVTPEQSAVLHFRAQLYRYLKGSPRFKEVKTRLQFLMTREGVIETIDIAHDN